MHCKNICNPPLRNSNVMDKALDWDFILGIAVDFLHQFVQEN